MKINMVEHTARGDWLAHAFVLAEDFPRVRETLWGLGCDSDWKLTQAYTQGAGYAGQVRIHNAHTLGAVRLIYGDSHWHVYDVR